MKLLAIARPRTGVDVSREIARLATDEMRMLWELCCDGVVRQMCSCRRCQTGGRLRLPWLACLLPLLASFSSS